MTTTQALEQVRALCTLAVHEQPCHWCNRIAAALKRAWADGMVRSSPLTKLKEAQRIRAEADALERGES